MQEETIGQGPKRGQCGDNSKPALTRSDCQKPGDGCPTLMSEKSRMYDEGFLEGATIIARGGDLLAEAYRRLVAGHGVKSLLAREVSEAYQNRKLAEQKQTQAAPSPDYGTAEVPFGSFAVDGFANWIPAEDPSCCVFVDTAGLGKSVLEHLRGLGIKARPLPKVAPEPPLCRAERQELYKWRSMFSRPDICRRTLDQLREAHGVLQRKLEVVRREVERETPPAGCEL